MSTPDAERKRKQRERQKFNLPTPTCSMCERQLKGKLSQERLICSRCWKKTPEGKAETLDRVRKIRSNQKDEN